MEKTVSITYLYAVFDYLKGLGVPVDRLEHSYSDIEQNHEQVGRVLFSRFQTLLDQAVELTGDSLLGLHLGEQIKPGYFSALGYVAMCSENLGQAMQKHLRYQNLVTDIGLVSLEEHEGDIHVVWRPQVEGVDRHTVENIFSAWICFGRWICGLDLKPIRILFQHQSSEDMSEYERIFKCPIRFGETRSAIIIPKSFLSNSLVQADSQLAHQFERQAEVLSKKLVQEQDEFLKQLKIFVIQHLPKGGVTLESVTKQFEMTTRTFQRQLTKRGHTFSEILDLARKELALEYIKDVNINLVELTFLLDFSDQPSFQRAFKRWLGVSPGQYRKDLSLQKG